MKKRRTFRLLFLLLFIPIRTQAQHPVLISEVFYDTSYNQEKGTIGNGEFVELYNAAEINVDISNWKLKGEGKDNCYVFPSNTVIKPLTTCVIAFRHQNIDYEFSELFPEISGISDRLIIYQNRMLLGNGGGTMALYNLEGILIDSLQYEATNYLLQSRKELRIDSDSTPTSITRQKATINRCDYVNIYSTDFTLGKANPLQADIYVVKQTGYVFSYDQSGNRTTKSVKTLLLSAAKSENGVSDIPNQIKSKETSVSDRLIDHEIVIFPNPTKGQLAIEIHNFQSGQKGELKIYSSNGLLIMQKGITAEYMELNLQEQLSGLYMMNIHIEDEVSVWKIYKQ